MAVFSCYAGIYRYETKTSFKKIYFALLFAFVFGKYFLQNVTKIRKGRVTLQ